MYFLLIFKLMIMSLSLFAMFLYFLIEGKVLYVEWELMSMDSMKVEYLILLDWISLLFLSVVVLISLSVFLYSIEYMEGDIGEGRFMILVLMFVLSMIMMIISPNMISILLGWDGLGLVSYCLVIFYQSESSFNSGMVTVLTNRVGDILILFLISLMMVYGSWMIMFLNDLSKLMMWLVVVISFTKSAQIPFSSWLPMAMAAPTPVSSLVHSSTLVTAGVYLLIRFSDVLINFSVMNVLFYISVITLFMSGLGANFETDMKKIIALSTLSQLGVMFFCLSLGLKDLAFFHLVTHAMFKSMLFMCAGVIIHNMLGNQDIRYISMVSLNLPVVSVIFGCASFSLCGVPFLSGFFSKDLILEMFMMGSGNKFMFCVLFISMGLTVSYSIRMVMLMFIKVPNLGVYSGGSSGLMIFSMVILFFMTNIMGCVLSWVIFSMKSEVYLPLSMKLMIFGFMSAGWVLGSLVQTKILRYLVYYPFIYKFILMMWFLPLVYGVWTRQAVKISSLLVKNMDLGWNEYLMAGGLVKYMQSNLSTGSKGNFVYFLLFFVYFIMVMLLMLS